MSGFLNNFYFFNLLEDTSPYLGDLLAVFCSVFAGLFIGWDREQSGKAAGFRTFALVCLGSTLFTLIGKELATLESETRIIGQIISGIGFIGAGSVFQEKNKISGLTTAAGIWVCSAIGVIFGLGYLPFGILISLFVIILFRLQKRAERLLFGACEFQDLEITFSNEGNKNQIKVLSAFEGDPRLNLRVLDSGSIDLAKITIRSCCNHKIHRSFLSELSSFDFITKIESRLSTLTSSRK